LGAFIDIYGLKFDRLTVVERAGFAPSGAITWRCRCECGGEITVLGQNIKNGSTKSCGCLFKELNADFGRRPTADRTSHGRSKTPEYRAWRNMRSRCYNPKDKRYEEYSSRGITVCEEWRNSFEVFLGHIGERPSAKHSLDRVENDKGYSPGNVRWATHLEQNNNKRTTPMVIYRGMEMSLGDARRASGSKVSHQTLRYRVLVCGWPLEEAM
jgi:hypothetical protein